MIIPRCGVEKNFVSEVHQQYYATQYVLKLPAIKNRSMFNYRTVLHYLKSFLNTISFTRLFFQKFYFIQNILCHSFTLLDALI